MWYIGQKLVCVDGRFPQQILDWATDLPRKGRVYTIRSMAHGKSLYTGEPKFGFRLEELQPGRCGFFAERFAPLLDALAEACQANASERSPAWVELPLLTPEFAAEIFRQRTPIFGRY